MIYNHNTITFNMQNNIIMVFDTETSGLPKRIPNNYFSPPEMIELYDNCRIVQFSAIIYDVTEGETLNEYDMYIKPDGFIITNSNIHGITQETAVNNGIKITEFFEKLIDIFKTYKISKIIGHNVMFDINVIKSEMFRYMKKHTLVNFPLLKTFSKLPYFCSMKNTVEICKLPNKNYPDKFKYPKLSELYNFIFGKVPENLHNSMNDTIYTLECIIELYNHELIKL